MPCIPEASKEDFEERGGAYHEAPDSPLRFRLPNAAFPATLDRQHQGGEGVRMIIVSHCSHMNMALHACYTLHVTRKIGTQVHAMIPNAIIVPTKLPPSFQSEGRILLWPALYSPHSPTQYTPTGHKPPTVRLSKSRLSSDLIL